MTKISKKIGKMWKDMTGVSPIIAVILMVAITVVLAATIYVWVSGFGGGGGGANIALTLKQTGHQDDTYLNYTVQSVNGNPGYDNIRIKIGGTTVWDGATVTGYTVTVTGKTLPSVAIEAGDEIVIYDDPTVTPNTTWSPGDIVQIIDINSGSVIYSAPITYA